MAAARTSPTELTAPTEPAIARQLEAIVDARVAALLGQPGARRRKLAIVASKGSLDWAYPPLMMATNAANRGGRSVSSSPSTV